MIAKYLIEEYKSRAQNCLSKGTLVEMSPSLLLKILAEVEAVEQLRAVDLPNESRQPSWADDGLDNAIIGSLP